MAKFLMFESRDRTRTKGRQARQLGAHSPMQVLPLFGPESQHVLIFRTLDSLLASLPQPCLETTSLIP